jgi:hypothetical protein
MTRILSATLLALASIAVAQTQSALTGQWQGETTNGTPIQLELTATSTTLTGTLTRDGQPLTITDGKVSKNTFTFRATLGDQTEGFTGEVAGDEIKVWLDRQGPGRAAILKRVK